METTLTRENEDGTEYEIAVKFTVSKYHPAVMYLRNGDPGYPAEGGEVEVDSAIRTDTGEEVELTDSEIEGLAEEASDEGDEGDEGDVDDRGWDEHEPSGYPDEGPDF